MIKVCSICGAEYEAHAAYCNACRQESLVAVETPLPSRTPPLPLIADPVALAFVAGLWLLGLGYALIERRPRSWESLGLTWLALALVSTAAALAMRNARMGAIFALLGLLFCAIYGLLVL